jgi:hypothetical protein
VSFEMIEDSVLLNNLNGAGDLAVAADAGRN